MKKRIISLLLVLSMLLCVLPAASAAETAKPKWSAWSITMNEGLTVNYKLPKDQFVEGTNYVTFTICGQARGRYEKPMSYDGDLAVFSVDIAPHELGCYIFADIYEKGNGYPVSRADKAASSYCYSVLTNESSSGTLKALIMDMVNYCNAFRDYKLTDSNFKWPNKTTETDQSQFYGFISSYSSYKTLASNGYRDLVSDAGKGAAVDGATVTFNGVALALNETVEIVYNINLPNGVSVEELTMKAELENSKTWNIAVKDYAELQEDGSYDVYFDKLDPTQMRDMVTVQFFNGETAVSNSKTYSIETYAMDPSEDVVSLCEYMIKYGDSARFWVENKNADILAADYFSDATTKSKWYLPANTGDNSLVIEDGVAKLFTKQNTKTSDSGEFRYNFATTSAPITDGILKIELEYGFVDFGTRVQFCNFVQNIGYGNRKLFSSNKNNCYWGNGMLGDKSNEAWSDVSPKKLVYVIDMETGTFDFFLNGELKGEDLKTISTGNGKETTDLGNGLFRFCTWAYYTDDVTEEGAVPYVYIDNLVITHIPAES